MEKTPAIRQIGDDDRAYLIDLARRAISARLENRTPPQARPDSEVLLEHRGAFVTLKTASGLRGCIGHVVGVSPLWRSVRDNSLAAAFEDPRFQPLSHEEWPGVVLEISALTPLEVVAPEDVVVGRDGVLVERGPARGLLLPQVAVECGWDREAFLDHTCRKAGLDPDCWRRPGTTISVFSAEVFGEKVTASIRQE